MRCKFGMFVAAVVAVLCSEPALAQQRFGPQAALDEAKLAMGLTPDIDSGRELYRICVVCHSPEGWGSHSGYYPQVAGQLPGVIIKQLADIRARNRDNPTMYPFSMPSTLGGAQEMANVAAYIAALPMSSVNDMGPGHDLELGERIYKHECAECHGDKGQGDAKDNIPLILGQHYSYLKRQFTWIRFGKRRNADKKMAKQIQRFTAREVSAVMDYVSRLRPPEGKMAGLGWRNPDFPDFSRHNLPVPMLPHDRITSPTHTNGAN